MIFILNDTYTNLDMLEDSNNENPTKFFKNIPIPSSIWNDNEISQIHKRSVGEIEGNIMSRVTKKMSDGKNKDYVCKKYNLDNEKYDICLKKIYVLECSNKKYYIGITSRNLNERRTFFKLWKRMDEKI